MSKKTLVFSPRNPKSINASTEDIRMVMSVAYAHTFFHGISKGVNQTFSSTMDLPSSSPDFSSSFDGFFSGFFSEQIDNMLDRTLNSEQKARLDNTVNELNQAFPTADGKSFIQDFHDVYRDAYADAVQKRMLTKNYLPDFIAKRVDSHKIHKEVKHNDHVTNFKNRHQLDLSFPQAYVHLKRPKFTTTINRVSDHTDSGYLTR